MQVAVIAGSFDPITNGHLDLIARAGKIFSRVWVLVANNPQKSYLFSPQERLQLCEESLGETLVEATFLEQAENSHILLSSHNPSGSSDFPSKDNSLGATNLAAVQSDQHLPKTQIKCTLTETLVVQAIEDLAAQESAQGNLLPDATFVLVKGVRTATDLEHEITQAHYNRRLGSLETLLLPTKNEYAHLSSSLVKELAKYDRWDALEVPQCVKAALLRKMGKS